MNIIYENGILKILASKEGEVVIVNKLSDGQDVRLNVTGHEDGHLALRSNNCRFDATQEGFNLWLL